MSMFDFTVLKSSPNQSPGKPDTFERKKPQSLFGLFESQTQTQQF